MLGEVVGAREGFVAMATDVWSLLCMGAHMSRAEVSIGNNQSTHEQGKLNYLLRCSNLLNNRPQDGIGHECDFCGYGPASITVALLARLIAAGRLISEPTP